MDPSMFKPKIQYTRVPTTPSTSQNPSPLPSQTSSSTSDPTPPPAYTPRASNPPLPSLPTPASISHLPFTCEDYEDEEFPPLSPVNISLHAPISIVGHNNIISTEVINTASAQGLAAGIIAALHQASSTVLMDEDGRARPINLSVTAGVSVLGSRNVLGKAVPVPMMAGVAKNRAEMMTPGVGESRKRRAESEPLERTDVKRAR